MTKEPRTLTEAEKAKYPAYRAKWDKIGLDCQPANRPEAEKALARAYEVLGFKPPKLYIWCQSPHQMSYARAVITVYHDGLVGSGTEADPWLTAEGCMAEWEAKKGRDPRKDEAVKKLVRDVVSECGYGQHDATSLAFYEFFREVCGLTEETEKAVPLFDAAKNCGWFLAHENVCFVCEKTTLCKFDEQGRLHNEDDAAIKYPDGWGLYVVHGTRVPKKVVTREFTAEDITKEQNAEVRRVMMRFYGEARYIQEIGLKPVNVDEFGTLYKVERPGDDPLAVVKVVNSSPEPDGTFKDYWLKVDPSAYGGLKTARAAVASTWRKPDGTMMFEKPEDYSPALET